MKSEFRSWLAVAGALTLALMLGVPAQAGRVEDTMTVTEAGQRSKMQAPCPARRSTVARCVMRSVKVAYGDLDLASQAGAQGLYVRLRGAAKTVCGARDGQYVQYVELRRNQAQCVDTTLDDAVAATGIERVVAMHREATGHDVQATSKLAGTP